MKVTFCALFMVAALGLALGAAAEKKSPVMFNFDADKPGEPPKGFEFGRTGQGAPGKWVVQAEKDAPSAPNVLAQVDTDATDYRFPVAFTAPEMNDLRLSVKCKPVAGKIDQGCGLVFRLKDADNYSLTGRRSSTRTTRPSLRRGRSASGPRRTRLYISTTSPPHRDRRRPRRSTLMPSSRESTGTRSADDSRVPRKPRRPCSRSAAHYGRER